MHSTHLLHVPPQRGDATRRALQNARASLIAWSAVARTHPNLHAERAAETAHRDAQHAGLHHLAVTRAGHLAHDRAARAGHPHLLIRDRATGACYCRRPDRCDLHVDVCGTCHTVIHQDDAVTALECGRVAWTLCTDCHAGHAATCSVCGGH